MNVDSSLMVKEKNANGAVRELRKRKANNSLNSSLDQSASSCKVVDDEELTRRQLHRSSLLAQNISSFSLKKTPELDTYLCI